MWKIPNWVAYELTKEKMQGTVKRRDSFSKDPNIPARYSAKQSDYTHSGWDRGHMVPAGDMKWSEQAMYETFYFSNICPQNRNLNNGVWHNLEKQVRDLAIQKKQIFIICGPIINNEDKVRTIGDSFVFVPDAFFKVLLCKHKGNWHSIAFVFPNEAGNEPLSSYVMSVSDLQEITGIRFFPNMPDSIIYDLKNNVDLSIWNIKANY
ncbi:MAG: DNA/RNA non-specific endonuclease [Bacteroidales bacterium]|jgi:endonuclease G